MIILVLCTRNYILWNLPWVKLIIVQTSKSIKLQTHIKLRDSRNNHYLKIKISSTGKLVSYYNPMKDIKLDL